MFLAGVAVAILAIEMSISSIGPDTGSGSESGSGSAPNCTIFAVKKSVKVAVPDCVDGPDYDYCPDDMQEYDDDVLDHGLVFINTNMTDITSIRESLEALLACDLDLDKAYFKVTVDRNERRYETDYSALMVAAHYDLGDIAETLLNHGADPNTKIYNDFENLHQDNALAVAASLGHNEVFVILIDNGADITEAFHMAASKGQADIVADLLDRGVDINYQEKGEDRMTALMTAAKLGHKDVFDLLIEKGADMNLQCNKENTALDYSLFDVWPGSVKSDTYFMTLLERGADVGVKNSKGNTILHNLSYCRDGCNKYYQALLDHGANINEKDTAGMTALMWAAKEGYPPYHNTAKFLVLGADANAQDLDGNTALIWAVSQDRRLRDKGPLVSLLMDGGADPNIRNHKSMAPLLLAARHKEGTGVLTVLAEKGANLDLRTDKQLTALMYAASNGRRDNVKVLLDRGADIDAQSAYGKTALHYAASSGDREMATLLMNRGADTCIRNQRRQTAHELAYDNGLAGLAQYMRRKSGNCN